MIIDCKCKKYKFKIPQQDITSTGRNVICEICKEEWFQPFSDPKNNLIDKMNPSSIKNTSKEKLIKKITYSHPLFTKSLEEVNILLEKAQGINNVWFAGAWLGYGFHEDGVKSAIKIRDMINV